MDAFELHRLCDGHVYRFENHGSHNAKPAFKRTDADLWIMFDMTIGWCARMPETNALAGQLWDVPLEVQGGFPCDGIWVCRKVSKSYVYRLIHQQNEATA